MEIDPTDVCMIDDCKELLPLATAMPTAPAGGLARLTLRFATLVSPGTLCRDQGLADPSCHHEVVPLFRFIACHGLSNSLTEEP